MKILRRTTRYQRLTEGCEPSRRMIEWNGCERRIEKRQVGERLGLVGEARIDRFWVHVTRLRFAVG